jgi:hypothetical protein
MWTWMAAVYFRIGIGFDSYITIICYIKFIQTRYKMSLVIDSNGSRILKLQLVLWAAFLFAVSLT